MEEEAHLVYCPWMQSCLAWKWSLSRGRHPVSICWMNLMNRHCLPLWTVHLASFPWMTERKHLYESPSTWVSPWIGPREQRLGSWPWTDHRWEAQLEMLAGQKRPWLVQVLETHDLRLWGTRKLRKEISAQLGWQDMPSPSSDSHPTHPTYLATFRSLKLQVLYFTLHE